MTIARTRRHQVSNLYWPGFVDAMASLLLVIIFLLTVFVIAQFFLSNEISGKDTVLNRLNSQINELAALLAIEKASRGELEEKLQNLQINLFDLQNEKESLENQINQKNSENNSFNSQIQSLEKELSEEQKLSQEAQSQVELLNQQILALRQQLFDIQSLLDASEKRDAESQAKIADLGQRLNRALAQRVQELSRYRSEFFGKLREILSQRSDIRVEEDRFVFQSEVLFSSGSDEINPAGQVEIKKLAEAILELQDLIPPEINWVLRVDGHTDSKPLLGTGRLRNNWDLSAARAISVVQFLINHGVDSNRLVAAGFGEYQPIDPGDSDEAHAKNRRIELKLTAR